MSRDYNIEMQDTTQHKYAYDFDTSVMHPFMLESFDPFFIKGSVLELGSYKGDFTSLLATTFSDITCIEASDVAIKLAKERLPYITYINDTFENAALTHQYDNVIITHVLEHLDDPVKVLEKIRKEWLPAHGRLFVAVPNANAPSRQIAVNMGLITHNTAVTESESKHGHRITYTLDTLERDARAAGLNIIHSGGIFFKALANFQWDQLLQTTIISKEYLRGCYQLGKKYPDLCSSIFIVCES